MLETFSTLTHAQRMLLAEVSSPVDPVGADAVLLVARVASLVRVRALTDGDARALLGRVESVVERLAADPASAATRAALWSLVEQISHRPWGIGAAGAIDRLVVAGAIADGLASERLPG